MPTIGEVAGTRIMMFPFDHDPPHVHAFGTDFRAKLAISDAPDSRESGDYRAGGDATIETMGTKKS
jgi:hypothetical protein